MSAQKIRNREEYWSPRVARKQHDCGTERSGCPGLIEPGERYVMASLPPNSEHGNVGWWHMKICLWCACMSNAELVDDLFGATTGGAS